MVLDFAPRRPLFPGGGSLCATTWCIGCRWRFFQGARNDEAILGMCRRMRSTADGRFAAGTSFSGRCVRPEEGGAGDGRRTEVCLYEPARGAAHLNQKREG